MKNTIRKWLGIDKLEARDKPPSEIQLRRMVGVAITEALEGKADSLGFWGMSCDHVANTLERALEGAATKPAREAAEVAIKELIGGEAFIDDVVERIRRKQLLS